METKSQSTPALPAGISEYIRHNFHEDYLTEINELRDKHGKVFYYVDLSHENNLYHMKFDEHGSLVQQGIEPSSELPEDELRNED